MADEKKKNIASNLPLITILILTLCVIGSAVPSITSVFIYDRQAVSEGEVWRIITCSFVHFNYTHLFYNLLAFGISGWITEKRGNNHFMLLCILMTTFIGIALFIFQSGMMYYGGLSGMACGAVLYCALLGLRDPAPWRNVFLCIVTALPIKIALEIYNNSSLLPYWKQQTFVTIPSSHFVGSIIALLFFLAVRKRGVDYNKVSASIDKKALTTAF